MNCNCITDVNAQLTEHYTASLATTATAKLQQVAYVMGPKMDDMLFIDVKITSEAKGYKKGKNVHMFVSFCPFCGKDQREKDTA